MIPTYKEILISYFQKENLFEPFHQAFIIANKPRYRNHEFIQYCQKSCNGNSLRNFFISAFVWNKTPQGCEFWNKMHTKWNNFLYQNIYQI